MPPKKAAPKSAAGAAVNLPATVTTSRGKEIETTAAAGRPKRDTAIQTPAQAAPAKKPAAAKTASRSKTAASAAASSTAPTKKRGRPVKVADDADVSEPPKKRGRPSKAETAAATPAKKRGPGRPPKKTKPAPAPAVPVQESAPPKARGRPPKGGETTKITAAEDAAAEQLEEELEDAVESDPSKPSTALKGKGKAVKTAGRGKKAAAQADALDDGEEAEAEESLDAKEAGAQQYWLMKAEQEDREETLKDGSVFNAKFTIDDLRQKGGPEPWDGVRNAVACKNMKAMKAGDLAFFYASGGKAGRVPGITGIMEVVKEFEADVSAFDETSPFFVDNPKMRGSADKPRWMMVHVEFRKKLSKPVTLVELKKFAAEGRVLAGMQEFTAARLSVSKVSPEEWNFIVNELIEGYEEDGHVDGAAATTLPNGSTHDHVNGVINTNAIKGIPIIPSLDGQQSDLATPDGVSSNGAVAASSSRAGSAKPASRAASAKPPSRAASRDPARRSISRGRSRVRKGSVDTARRQTVAVPEEMEVIEE